MAVSLAMPRRQHAWLGLIVPLLLLAAWELASRRGGNFGYAFVPLAEVGRSLTEMLAKAESWNNLAASLWTASSGFAVGSLFGVALGSAMALSRRVEQVASTAVQRVASRAHARNGPSDRALVRQR